MLIIAEEVCTSSMGEVMPELDFEEIVISLGSNRDRQARQREEHV